MIDLLLRASVQFLTLWTILDELLSLCLDLDFFFFAWNQVLNIQYQTTVSSLFSGTTCLYFLQTCHNNVTIYFWTTSKPLFFYICYCYQIPQKKCWLFYYCQYHLFVFPLQSLKDVQQELVKLVDMKISTMKAKTGNKEPTIDESIC